MEAAGLIGQFSMSRHPAICDYSDSHKNKQWKGFGRSVLKFLSTPPSISASTAQLIVSFD
jgi:hypothetical protein